MTKDGDGYLCQTGKIEDLYDVKEELGRGQFAVVKRCVSKENGDAVAAKFVKIKRTRVSKAGLSREAVQREAAILSTIQHKNILKFHNAYDWGANEMVLVMELLCGGELFDKICEMEFMTEIDAALYLKQVLEAINYIHNMNIVHLDIKPENIVLKRKEGTEVKLVDFGLAQRLVDGQEFKEMMGTPEFVAPEIVNYDEIGLYTDMWAIGVLAYVLLSGYSPFLGDDNQETYENITNCDYGFDEEYFDQIADDAKDFVAQLLVKNVKKRNTVKDCLKHPWLLRLKEARNREVRVSVINTAAFRTFVARRRWKESLQKLSALSRFAKSIKSPSPQRKVDGLGTTAGEKPSIEGVDSSNPAPTIPATVTEHIECGNEVHLDVSGSAESDQQKNVLENENAEHHPRSGDIESEIKDSEPNEKKIRLAACVDDIEITANHNDIDSAIEVDAIQVTPNDVDNSNNIDVNVELKYDINQTTPLQAAVELAANEGDVTAIDSENTENESLQAEEGLIVEGNHNLPNDTCEAGQFTVETGTLESQNTEFFLDHGDDVETSSQISDHDSEIVRINLGGSINALDIYETAKRKSWGEDHSPLEDEVKISIENLDEECELSSSENILNTDSNATSEYMANSDLINKNNDIFHRKSDQRVQSLSLEVPIPEINIVSERSERHRGSLSDDSTKKVRRYSRESPVRYTELLLQDIADSQKNKQLPSSQGSNPGNITTPTGDGDSDVVNAADRMDCDVNIDNDHEGTVGLDNVFADKHGREEGIVDVDVRRDVVMTDSKDVIGDLDDNNDEIAKINNSNNVNIEIKGRNLHIGSSPTYDEYDIIDSPKSKESNNIFSANKSPNVSETESISMNSAITNDSKPFSLGTAIPQMNKVDEETEREILTTHEDLVSKDARSLSLLEERRNFILGNRSKSPDETVGLLKIAQPLNDNIITEDDFSKESFAVENKSTIEADLNVECNNESRICDTSDITFDQNGSVTLEKQTEPFISKSCEGRVAVETPSPKQNENESWELIDSGEKDALLDVKQTDAVTAAEKNLDLNKNSNNTNDVKKDRKPSKKQGNNGIEDTLSESSKGRKEKKKKPNTKCRCSLM